MHHPLSSAAKWGWMLDSGSVLQQTLKNMTAAWALSWKAKAEANVQMQLSGEARPEGQWDADHRGVPAQAWPNLGSW